MKGVSKLLLVFIIGLSQFSFGQKTNKYSNEYMNLGAGARAFGMGNSVIATTKDVTAGYWNPAGLSGVEANIDLSFMHSEYFGGIANYDYLAFASKIDDKSAIGITALRLGVDGILNTLSIYENGQIDYTKVTEFSVADYGILLSYARKKKLRKYNQVDFSYGVNGKIIHRKAGDFARAWGFGADIGAKMHMKKTGWDIGLTIKDITSTFNSWTYTFTDEEEQVLLQTNNIIPVKSLEITLPRILFGVAKKFEWNKVGLTSEFDLDITTDGKRNTLIRGNILNLDPHFGIEFGYKKIIYFTLPIFVALSIFFKVLWVYQDSSLLNLCHINKIKKLKYIHTTQLRSIFLNKIDSLTTLYQSKEYKISYYGNKSTIFNFLMIVNRF